MRFIISRHVLTRRLKLPFGRSSRSYSSRGICEENTARYCVGGYHPVKLGDIFNKGKYEIISKLGYGVYSTVWLAFDRQYAAMGKKLFLVANASSRVKQHVALKILTADSFGQEKDTFEIDILKHIRNEAVCDPRGVHVLQLLDSFQHDGPNGAHACLVFPAMGPDMSKYRRLFPGLRIPPPVIKNIARQLLLALSYLHDTCQVIHTDIKPQNILLETSSIREMFEHAPPEAFAPDSQAGSGHVIESIQVSSADEDLAQSTDVSVKLADFGTASWFDNHLTEWIQPQMLRAPEVILGAKWDYKVDIWNMGLILWELAERQLLFDGTWTPKDGYSSEAHLAQITAVLGNIPASLLDRSCNRSLYFDADGNLLQPSTFPPCSLETFSKNHHVSSAEKKKFLEFISSMVQIDPKERLDARKLLESPWLA